MESRNQLVLVGVVTGNPIGCNSKTLPDVFNFVGNQEVNRKSDEYLILRIIFIHVVKEKKTFSYYNLRYISVISDSAMD